MMGFLPDNCVEFINDNDIMCGKDGHQTVCSCHV